MTTEHKLPRWVVRAALVFVVLVYLHNTLPLLTMLPRVNVDEPWLMERAYQVWTTGIPSQPMLRLERPYFLQVGYDYLYAPWFGAFGVGMFQARLLSVLLGLGIVLLVFAIGRRLAGAGAGLLATAFLAADSNFLGNARMSRTDIPSVFFAGAALWCFLRAREWGARWWHVASGACAGAAMVCHGNGYWVVVVLAAWYTVSYGAAVVRTAPIYLCALGGLITFGPYLAIVLANWEEVQTQIGNFAAGRAPSPSPPVVLQYVLAEIERYRGWYFGLVTNTVPNPFLWCFEAATAGGFLYVFWRAVQRSGERLPYVLLAILGAGTVVIFAGFIPNKAHVYMPNLLVGFSLLAGTFVAALVQRVKPAPALAALLAVVYGAASVAYYEKWYETQRKSELVPYESTEATIRALVPEGPKDVFASPNLWVPFHAQPDVRFRSYTGATPLVSGERMVLNGFGVGRPIYLLIDESEWRAVATDPQYGYTEPWRSAWVRYVTEQCALDGVAYGTAFGNLASFECRNGEPPPRGEPVIVGGSERFRLGPVVWAPGVEELAKLPRYADARRSADAPPARVEIDGDAVRVSGTEWPGLATDLAVTPGERYLLRFDAEDAQAGDLVYLGRWDDPQVLTLSGAGSAGFFGPLAKTSWFPGDRGFIATSSRVWLRVYSEAPSVDFRLRSLKLYQLVKAGE